MRKEKWEELHSLIQQLRTVQLKKQEEVGTFIQSERFQCTLNNGKIITREKLLKGGGNGSAAVILPMSKENVILVVEPRVFSKRTVGIGLPAGYIEKGEEASVAALRELKEEIGCIPKQLLSLGGFYQDMGCSEAFNECFLALDCQKVSEQQLDKDEYIEYFECTFEEMVELIDKNYIQDCNSLIAVEKAKKLLRRKNVGH